MSKKMKLQLLKEFDIDNTFKKLIRTRDDGNQFVFGRELAKFWGYDRWEKFLEIIKKGIKNYPNSTTANKDIDLQEIVEIELNTDFDSDRDDRNPDFIKVKEKVKTAGTFVYRINYEISLNAVMFCVNFADKNKPVVMNFAIAIGSYIKFLERELKRLADEAKNPYKKFFTNTAFLSFKEAVILRVINANDSNYLTEIFSRAIYFLFENQPQRYRPDNYKDDFKSLISEAFNCFYISFYGVDKKTLCKNRGLSPDENPWDWFDDDERVFLKAIRDKFKEEYLALRDKGVILSFKDIKDLIKKVVVPFKVPFGDTVKKWKFRETKLTIDRGLATRLKNIDKNNGGKDEQR